MASNRLDIGPPANASPGRKILVDPRSDCRRGRYPRSSVQAPGDSCRTPQSKSSVIPAPLLRHTRACRGYLAESCTEPQRTSIEPSPLPPLRGGRCRGATEGDPTHLQPPNCHQHNTHPDHPNDLSSPEHQYLTKDRKDSPPMHIPPARRRRILKVHHLRQQGKPLRKIAEQLKISHATVHADLKLVETHWSRDRPASRRRPPAQPAAHHPATPRPGPATGPQRRLQPTPQPRRVHPALRRPDERTRHPPARSPAHRRRRPAPRRATPGAGSSRSPTTSNHPPNSPNQRLTRLTPTYQD